MATNRDTRAVDFPAVSRMKLVDLHGNSIKTGAPDQTGWINMARMGDPLGAKSGNGVLGLCQLLVIEGYRDEPGERLRFLQPAPQGER